MKISAIILGKKKVPSVSWCDEVINVDTEKIPGSFSEWRNWGAVKAKGDWIFYVDTDEIVPENLKLEILELIKNYKLKIKNSAYAIPRRNFIFGKEFKHGGQWPDYQKRLFLRKSFKKWVGELHEESVFEGTLGLLKNPLIHHKNISITQMVEKTNNWSELEAKLMFDAKHPPMNAFNFFCRTQGILEKNGSRARIFRRHTWCNL